MSNVTRLSLLDDIRQTSSSERWPEFVSQYGHLLRQWMTNQRINRHDADDIQQEVMSVVFEELPRFDHNGRPGAFRNWLRKIMANRMRRLWERRSAQKIESNLSEIADQLEDENSTLSLGWEREHNQYFVGALLEMAARQFSPRAISIFRKVNIEGVAPAEVAEEFGVTIGALRVQQHRILRFLKQAGEGLVDI